MDQLQARGVFAALWRCHDDTSYDWRSVLLRAVGGVQALRHDAVGVLEAMEAEAARLEAAQGGTVAGWLTPTAIVWGETPQLADTRRDELVKLLRGLGFACIDEGLGAERAWTHTHHVEVRWRYPDDVLAALNAGATAQAPISASGALPSPRLRHCAYRLAGDTPPWRPAATADGQPPVCDDGEVTTIHLPPGILGAEGIPGVWRLERDTRLPVQAGRVGDTLQVAGVHPRLVLALGDAEVRVVRRR